MGGRATAEAKDATVGSLVEVERADTGVPLVPCQAVPRDVGLAVTVGLGSVGAAPARLAGGRGRMTSRQVLAGSQRAVAVSTDALRRSAVGARLRGE